MEVENKKLQVTNRDLTFKQESLERRICGQTVKLKENIEAAKKIPNFSNLEEFTCNLNKIEVDVLNNRNEFQSAIDELFRGCKEAVNGLLCDRNSMRNDIKIMHDDFDARLESLKLKTNPATKAQPSSHWSCRTCGSKHDDCHDICPYDPHQIFGLAKPDFKVYTKKHTYKNTASLKNNKWTSIVDGKVIHKHVDQRMDIEVSSPSQLHSG